MAPQRAGQKRKLVEVPRPTEDTANGFLEDNRLDGVFHDEGDSDDNTNSDSEEDELHEGSIDENEEEELDSDEIPSSEDEEDIESQFQKSRAKPNHTTLSGRLTGSITDIGDLSLNAPANPTDEDPGLNYLVEEDANGNPRYVYKQIEPVYDSDDSDAPLTSNTIGNIPLSYYDAYPHIGYDINGRKIARPAKGEALDSLLDSIEIPEGWTGLTDPSTGKPLQLSVEELDTLKKLTRNEAPGEGYDPYPEMVEYFTGKGMEEIMPLSAAPEPKRRFVPSVHEHKRVMKMVKAIKEGRIKPYREKTAEDLEKEEAEQDFVSYDVWADEAPRPDHPMNVPAPKLPPPGYAESYHPPPEYLPDKQEREVWEEQDEEDRDRDFLPEDHSALRRVPGYERFVKEKFERCLDLYLAPRVRRSKLNIDPESLLPKLPDPAELKPFPTKCETTMLGHEGRVRSISIDPTARFIASGGEDGTVRVWTTDGGHPVWRAKLSSDDAVNVVSWRPGQQACILTACCGDTVYFIIPEKIGYEPELLDASNEVLDAGFGYAAPSKATNSTESQEKRSSATWSRPSTSLREKGVRLILSLKSAPKTLAWHRRGEYFSTVTPSSSAVSTSIAIHTLSKHQTQYPFRRLRGLAQTVCFHSSKPLFFVATRQRIRIYNLQEQKLEKELLPGARWISAISLHPMGDNLLVSSYDKRLLWHDLDMGNVPYKTLRYHSKAIRSVKFHPLLPLFADASDDGSLQVFHGKVVNDIMENATVVPLKVLRGHKVKSELGVLDVEWHPRDATLFSAGADGAIKIWT